MKWSYRIATVASIDIKVHLSFVLILVRVDIHDSLESVREALAEASQRVAAVFSSDRYLGLVSTEDIGEAFTVLTFLNKQRDRASTAAAA